MLFSAPENETIRDRIEKILNKVKTFTNRKRQELHQSIDSGYGSIDLTRRSIDMKSFIKDVDLETSHLSEVNDLILTLIERKCDQQIIRSLEKKTRRYFIRSSKFDQRRQYLLQAERSRDIYLNECKLYEDIFNLTMERLSRSIQIASTNHDTRTCYLKHHHDLEKRSNDLQDKIIEQTIYYEYLLHEIQKQLPLTKRLLHFEQIQAAFVLYEDLRQRLVVIEPELLHLNDEIQNLCKELNVVSLENDIVNVKDNFIRISNDIREKFDRLINEYRNIYQNNHYFIAKYVIIHLLSCSLALVPSNFNDNIIKLSEQVKQGYSREELLRKLNSLEESIHDRNRQLNRANEPRREFDRIISKLSQWIKTTEQQIKDPLTNHLQQTTNSLKEKYKSIQALLQSTKDRTNLFDDLRQKYNRLLDNLTQRLTLLDEANQQFKQLLKRLNQTNNNLKELRRLQRLLTSKGHRIDFRRGGQLNANFKNLQGKIHNEIERIERVLQRENDFYHLEKELESYLQISSEHFKSGQYQQDKRIDYQAIFDRLQQNEQGLNKLIQLAERLKPELSQYLQTLIKTCQQARGEHEHKVKTQNKLNEELIPINDCFKRLIQELTQPIDLYLSLNYLNHIQDSMAQLNVSIDQRLLRLDQALRDQPNLISSNDKEIRERLNTVEELKHQVKNHLNKRRTILDDIHQRMTQYLKLTADIKTAILYEYSKSFNSVDKLFCYFLLFFSDADFKLAPFFHGYYQTRIHQRRKELDEIRQKSNRFNSSLIRLQSDTDRLLHTIEKAPDSAETLISEIDSTFSALQYLGGDLKKSLDISSSSDIDRELKDMASPVETIRDSLDRAKRSYEENETIRDRIEKILNKSFIKDVDLETSHLSQVNDLILTLTERKCHQQIIRSLEKKQEDILQDLLKSFVLLIFFYYLNLSLKNETTKTIENLDQKVQEQEKLRQNACTMLSIIQRTKVQLIELRPTINDETDQKLKKIDDDLTTNYELFEQSLNNYKLSELNAYNTIRDEYENLMENTLKIIQIIENKTQQSHGIDLRQNLDLLKDLTNEMQTHRSLIDRLQLLSSTLSSQLIDTNERERRRLNEIIRRWTQLEQDLMSEEEMKNLTELYHYINRNCQQWLKQTRILINDLTNTRNVETFDQLIRKGKNISFEYRTSLEHLQRLRNRLNQLVQTNRTPQASQKLNEVDRLLNEMTTCRENLEQRLDLFYEQWLENIQRTHDTISEQTLTTDEKVTTLS
ncbi:unnamed protein product [Rotaria sordida]|uniref:Uncharacterized protein n=2 Tax=Rotaria sordida TaxID=392033 RepID=A0A814W1N5_9BILA|nr:unnamed protein product [Rotaria sordida]